MAELEIRFKVTDEDKDELIRFLQAEDIAVMLHEYDQWLRAKIKYSQEDGKIIDIYQECRDELYNKCRDYNIEV